ncbi:MAG TPA: carbohydrate kinase [Armatimonadota bacterium]|jgi:fructokinase
MHSTINSPHVFGVGEILWDLLPHGKQLGGAPTNFAYYARALGAQATVVSGIGHDANGDEILQRLHELGISRTGIFRHPSLPTGTVSVTLNPAGHPSYHIQTEVAWDAFPYMDAIRAAIQRAHAVCFGTLAQRCPASRQTIQALLCAAPAHALRVFDINLRQDYFNRAVIEASLKLANVLKLNEHELPIVRDLLGLVGNEMELLRQLRDRFGLRMLALTKGEAGSVLLQGDELSVHPGIATTVVDTVGAGDAFTAALTMGLLYGYPLAALHAHASRVAAFVCSCSGATTPLPDELLLAPTMANQY